jgi:hypothetical protein
MYVMTHTSSDSHTPNSMLQQCSSSILATAFGKAGNTQRFCWQRASAHNLPSLLNMTHASMLTAAPQQRKLLLPAASVAAVVVLVAAAAVLLLTCNSC